MVVPAAELNRQIFNGGSVGQPRDGDPRASYLIYDTDKKVIEFYRVAYDFERAGEKIIGGRFAGNLCPKAGERPIMLYRKNIYAGSIFPSAEQRQGGPQIFQQFGGILVPHAQGLSANTA